MCVCCRVQKHATAPAPTHRQCAEAARNAIAFLRREGNAQLVHELDAFLANNRNVLSPRGAYQVASACGLRKGQLCFVSLTHCLTCYWSLAVTLTRKLCAASFAPVSMLYVCDCRVKRSKKPKRMRSATRVARCVSWPTTTNSSAINRTTI